MHTRHYLRACTCILFLSMHVLENAYQSLNTCMSRHVSGWGNFSTSKTYTQQKNIVQINCNSYTGSSGYNSHVKPRKLRRAYDTIVVWIKEMCVSKTWPTLRHVDIRAWSSCSCFNMHHAFSFGVLGVISGLYRVILGLYRGHQFTLGL